MHPSTNLNDIKQAINNIGHEVKNIWNIKQYVTKKSLPLFAIELKQGHKNKEIYKVKTLLNCHIQFEAPRPKRTIPQCVNCQRYGHEKLLLQEAKMR